MYCRNQPKAIAKMFLEVVDLMHLKKTSEDFHLVKIKNFGKC